jgi:glutaminyl-tRNA synthetase
MNEKESTGVSNFIRNIIDKDLASGKHVKIITRFPPEPNGYLHIGHTKSICLNFGIARDYNGICHLRFDDTNPEAEDVEYVDSIMEDIRWLGWDWGTKLFFASDYYDKLYDYAEILIKDGKAFVCDLSPEEMNKMRGTLTQAGTESPWRNRSAQENLDLFRRMKAGEFDEGTKTLRAKIDMASGNINMRDLSHQKGTSPPHR